jgi:hypothetical protein
METIIKSEIGGLPVALLEIVSGDPYEVRDPATIHNCTDSPHHDREPWAVGTYLIETRGRMGTHRSAIEFDFGFKLANRMSRDAAIEAMRAWAADRMLGEM